MTIISAAAVPSHLTLLEADTVEGRTSRTLADWVDEMIGVGLSVVQIAEALHVTAYEAFKAGARIRTSDDVTAVAATMAAPTPAEQANTAAFGAAIAAMPLAEQADRYGVSLATAARVRDLYAARRGPEAGR